MQRRPFSSLQQSTSSLHPGQLVHGFEVRQTSRVDELDVTIYRLKHVKSGANYVHLLRDDPTSVFAIGFRTIPTDSSGVAHVLEHNVLCGSQKYPVRDPFFRMLNRSLASYMNAWTLSDHTLYPFSTENGEDFANLRDIYFDACFSPLLRYEDFLQEGWRLDAAEGKPEIVGVVYNEMKGAMSDPDAVFAEAWQRLLFGGTTYGHNSGGDPMCIPRLSHALLVDFHRKHYTPANALFLGYGALMDDNMRYLDHRLSSSTLSKTTRGVCPSVKQMTTINSPIVATVGGPVDPLGDPEAQFRTLIAFRTNPLIKVQESFHMQLLSHLLLDGPTSPMHKALIESGLGGEYSSGTGYHPHATITAFGFGVQGAQEKSLPLIGKAVWDCLKQVQQDSISPARIDSALHQIQLGLKYKSASFGLNLVASVMAGWTRGIYPEDQLPIHSKVSEFTRRLQRKHVLEPLIDKWMLNNRQRVELTMRPDPDYTGKLKREERELANSIYSTLTAEQIDSLARTNQDLAASQMTTVDVDGILPMLRVSDVSRDIKKPSLLLDNRHQGVRAYTKQTVQANGLTYCRFVKVFKNCLPPHLELLPLALQMFTEYGVQGKSMEEYEESVKRTCSGFSFGHILRTADDLRLCIACHSLDEKLDATLELLQETLKKTDHHNHNRLRTHVLASAAAMANAIATSGHRFALSAAASRLGGKFVMSDVLGGLQQARLLSAMVPQIDDPQYLRQLSQQIAEIHSFLLGSAGEWRVAVISKEDCVAKPITLLQSFPTVHPTHLSTPPPPTEYGAIERFPINTAYAAACAIVSTTCPEEKAALCLAAELLKSKFLHREVREKQGAYGASASYNHLDGLLSFHSYRDPLPRASLQAFQRSLEWLKTADSFGQKDLDEAKLCIIGAMDAPQDLGDEGLADFKHDLGDLERRMVRHAILECTSSDVVATAGRLLDPSISPLSTCIVMGAEE